MSTLAVDVIARHIDELLPYLAIREVGHGLLFCFANPIGSSNSWQRRLSRHAARRLRQAMKLEPPIPTFFDFDITLFALYHDAYSQWRGEQEKELRKLRSELEVALDHTTDARVSIDLYERLNRNVLRCKRLLYERKMHGAYAKRMVHTERTYLPLIGLRAVNKGTTALVLYQGHYYPATIVDLTIRPHRHDCPQFVYVLQCAEDPVGVKTFALAKEIKLQKDGRSLHAILTYAVRTINKLSA